MTPEGGRAGFPETADIVTSSDGYAARFGGPVGEWMLGVQRDIVLSWVQESGARTVLDVGGGHGQLAIPLAQAGFDVTVIGSDESCAKRVRGGIDAGRVKFIIGNLIDLPFAAKSFDLVVSVRLLPHCGQWQKLIAEFCRVARTGVLVDYPAKQGFNKLAPLFFGAKKKLEGNTRAWRDFTHAEVEAEFAAGGFPPGRRTGQFSLPMVIHRTLKSPPISVALEAPFKALGLTRRWGSPVVAEFRRKSGPTNHTN